MELIMNEETKILEGEEAQKAVDEAAQRRAEDPFEVAAMVHSMYYGQFMEGIENISGNSCRRILKFLVSYPLLQEEAHAASPKEEQLTYLADRLCEAKFLMIMNEFNNRREEILSKIEEAEKLEGEKNGKEA
jgi:hypothetical protein